VDHQCRSAVLFWKSYPSSIAWEGRFGVRSALRIMSGGTWICGCAQSAWIPFDEAGPGRALFRDNAVQILCEI